MNNHLMLDIETAGTGPHAYVLTIGILAFDPYGNGDNDVGFHYVVPQHANLGRQLTFDTIKWWMQQNGMAQGQAWLAAPHNLMEITGTLIGQLKAAEHVWANDPDFDCVILNDWLTGSGASNIFNSFKWPYYKNRSIRTLKALFDIPQLTMEGAAHNALDDCKYQAKIVRAVYKGEASPVFESALTFAPGAN